MKIEDIINNTWFVGIGGGIISGIIVFYISKYILEKRSKSEYLKNIREANEFVKDYIRSYVVEIELPSSFIIESVKNAVAREMGVDVKEMDSLKNICEDLIKETIGNVYFSTNDKKEYIESIEKYMIENDNNEKFAIPPEEVEKSFSSKNIEIISILSGLITALALVIAIGIWVLG